MKNKALITVAIGLLTLIIATVWVWPFSWNDYGYREVVETWDGDVSVRFDQGFYYTGPLSKVTRYPDVTSVSFGDNLNAEVNLGISLPLIDFMFKEGSLAKAKGISRYELPTSEPGMLKIHKDYKSPENFSLKFLKSFTTETLKASGQLMSAEQHYSGGQSTLSQYFDDQSTNGIYILESIEKDVFDSLERQWKKSYIVRRVKNDDGTYRRKKNPLSPYGISSSYSSISNVDYNAVIDSLIIQRIEVATKASLSRESLLTAQQEIQTKEAEGEKELIEAEYEEKIKQRVNEVQAETRVVVAQSLREEQKALDEAAKFEAQRIERIAQANANAAKAKIKADNALELRLQYEYKTDSMRFVSFRDYKGPSLVPNTVMAGNDGGGSNNATESVMSLFLMDQLEGRSNTSLRAGTSKGN